MSSSNNLRNVRRMARAAYVGTLRSAFDKCGYCGEVVVWRELAPEGAAVRSSGRYIAWFGKENEVLRYKAATVEHITPLSKGGGNLLTNLMAACYWCNNERGTVPPQRKQSPLRKAKQLFKRRF